MYQFEFDLKKSHANGLKHGIDFVEGQRLWQDIDRLEIPARTDDEPRSIIVGRIGAKYWSAVVTYRQEKTRIISIRPARRSERDLYEG